MAASLLSQLRSAYAWALLSVIVLTLIPVAWVFRRFTAAGDPRADRLRIFSARWISLYGRWTPLYRFQIEGRENLPRGPYVLIANHESGLDVLCLLQLATPARFLAERWMFRIPLAAGLFRNCRHIPVDAGSGRAALAEAEQALKQGTPVALFPEGRLSPDALAEFRPGAFILAQRARVPLVPVRIDGAGRAWRPGTLTVHGRHEIRIAVLPPLHTDSGAVEVAVLSDRVRAMLLDAAREPAVRGG